MTLWLASETIIISLSSWVVVSRPAWLIIVIKLRCSLIRTHADDHISELYLFDTPIMMSCIQAQLLYWHGRLYNVISYFPRFPDVYLFSLPQLPHWQWQPPSCSKPRTITEQNEHNDHHNEQRHDARKRAATVLGVIFFFMLFSRKPQKLFGHLPAVDEMYID